MKSHKRKRIIEIAAQSPSDHCRLNCRGENTPITELNHDIDAYRIPWDINESVIENILHQWEQHDMHHLPGYWLVAARIFEMALLCTGHYVDSCEFEAACDLLFNPRKILIYLKGCPRPITKHRHGRLSDQLCGHKPANEPFPSWFKRNAATRITKPAVISYLLNCLEQSGCMSERYLQTAHERMQKASQAIGFLCSWSISCTEDLQRRVQTATPETRRFITRHLCNFNTAMFDALGKDIMLLCENSSHRSDFIAQPGYLEVSSTSKRR